MDKTIGIVTLLLLALILLIGIKGINKMKSSKDKKSYDEGKKIFLIGFKLFIFLIIISVLILSTYYYQKSSRI